MNFKKYQVLRSIGKGGMGEVFLAHDPVCGRDVALKKMKEQWQDNRTMRDRFLREARIAAQLSHPSIIPIYSIDESAPFYTMPHVQGETLKEILMLTRDQAKNGEALHSIGSSVPSLVRIFLSVCGAVGFAHDRGVLHRDLKPENIIIGKYGEVIILDWGLADFIGQPEMNGLNVMEESSDLTQPGKIPGTLLYMAPERAFGAESSVQTDIYSLGVVLYQLLTLQFPFQRKSMKEFRKLHSLEKILDPEEVAPDRDISLHLSSIVKKCLAKTPEQRYHHIKELIFDLENYIAGLPEWIPVAKLNLHSKADWEFQENIPLAKHMALTRGIEMLEWFSLMVSKGHFPGNLQIQTEITLKQESNGVGILFSIPEHKIKNGVEESYCLWLSVDGVRLYRANVEVFRDDKIKLETNRPYRVQIEHIENHVRLFLDGVQKLGFLNHLPLPGSRVGLITSDGNFSITDLEIAVGSQNIMVNCLAIPDAFRARKDYNEALKEYRNISRSFPGRAEGREATFRAGVTLLKKATFEKQKKTKEALFLEALDEFERLHHTPGAPLEYLGKSYVYKAQGEYEEEAKCFELALRKFPKHPLRPILVENILSRLHESSQTQRQVAYRFALIVLRYLAHTPDAQAIAEILEKNIESLPFFAPSEERNLHLIIQLAFWLNKPLALLELLEKGIPPRATQNAHIALILLGCEDLANMKVLDKDSEELLHARFEYTLKTKGEPTKNYPLWKALYQQSWNEAETIATSLPKEVRENEDNTHFFLYGCYLASKLGEQEASEHLTNISEIAFPKTTALLSHYLMGRINLKKGWIEKAFYWEKLKLLQQLELFAICLKDDRLKQKAKTYRKKLQ